MTLKEISLEIRKGEVVAFVGMSGAGKSTLMDLVPRFHDVTAGRITLDGRDLDRKSTRLNSSHGYISYAVFCLKKKNGAADALAPPVGHIAQRDSESRGQR